MSTRKGDNKKQGQRHQNGRAYKNDLNDTSERTKALKSLTVGGVCRRCKDVVEWKIKYKKYKPLTVPKKCTACFQKTVRVAYYIICQPCAEAKQVCAKCGQKSEITDKFIQSDKEKEAEEVDFRFMLSQMKEREKRAFLREHLASPKRIGKDSIVASPTSDTHSYDDDEEESMTSSLASGEEETSADLQETIMDSADSPGKNIATSSENHAPHVTAALTDGNIL